MKTVQECIDYVNAHMEVRYATNNGAYKAGKTIKPKGCVNHSVGVAQPSVDVFFDVMNRSSATWGVNAIIGDFHKGEGKILLVMPLDRRPWGCASGVNGSWNDSRVQWEICEPSGHHYAGGTIYDYDIDGNQEYFDRMWKLLVAWNVYCANKFGYDIYHIADHSESYRAGYGSNHSDISQWIPIHGKSMDDLRKEVGDILSGKANEPVIDNTPDIWADSAVKNAIKNKILFGDGNGNLALHKECTRQEMIVFLYRYYNMIMKN